MDPYEQTHLEALPRDVRAIVLATVRTLIERGPRGLVEERLCPAEWEASMAENLRDYPGNLIEPPASAEIFGHSDPSGTWTIDLPLHNDREGRMDLFLFLEIDPKAQSAKVRGIYTP